MPRKRDEINKFIHERILGKCWHEAEPIYAEGSIYTGVFACKKCRYEVTDALPDYCSDSESRSLLNEVVAAVVGKCGAVEYSNYIADQRQPHPVNRHEFAHCIVTATAEQIARACYEAWEARESPELVK